METRYRLSTDALQLLQGRDTFRRKAVRAMYARLRTQFTEQEAIDALVGVDLGSGTAVSFVTEFIKIKYLQRVPGVKQ